MPAAVTEINRQSYKKCTRFGKYIVHARAELWCIHEHTHQQSFSCMASCTRHLRHPWELCAGAFNPFTRAHYSLHPCKGHVYPHRDAQVFHAAPVQAVPFMAIGMQWLHGHTRCSQFDIHVGMDTPPSVWMRGVTTSKLCRYRPLKKSALKVFQNKTLFTNCRTQETAL